MNFLKKLLFGILLAGTVLAASSCSLIRDFDLQELTWASGGPLPRAEDFIVGELPDGYSARYAQRYEFTAHKTYPLEIIIKANNGFEVKYDVKLTLVEDTTPPEVDGLKDLIAYVGGEGVAYRRGVTPRDNCDGEVTLDVDSSAVNLKKKGVYPVVHPYR